MPWVRVGSCNQCGRCCYLSNLLGAAANKDVQCNQDPSELVCKHLTFEGKVAVCSVFGTDQRPAACSLHPSSTYSLTPGCTGYYYIYVERGDF
jgi:hypothetical protein